MIESDQIVREYEKKIDSHFRSFPIFTYPVAEAVYGVLAAYDSCIVPHMMIRLANDGRPLGIGQQQYLKMLTEGVVWATRWLLFDTTSVRALPTPNRTLIADGGNLIQYGSKYDPVCDMYVSYSRGFVSATVEPSKRLVRFDYLEEFVRNTASWGFFDEVENDQPRRTVYQQQRSSVYLSRLQRSFQRAGYELRDGRVVLRSTRGLGTNEVLAYLPITEDPNCQLRAETEVVGFTIGHFRTYWRALAAWSACAMDAYLGEMEGGTEQQNCMPTQVVPRPQFVDWISSIARLNSVVVDTITALLTFDRRTKHPDLFLQPFIVGDDAIAWSPFVIQQSRPERNLLKLMARTSQHKAIADNLIGARETPLLQEVADQLERRHWKVTRDVSLRSADVAQIDLLGWHADFPTQLLLVEAKAVLRADALSEVQSVTEEMQRGQSQVDRARRILAQLSEEQKSNLVPIVEWSRVDEVYCVIITIDTEPGLGFDHSVVPAASLVTLKRALNERNWNSPKALWSAMVQREWHNAVRETTFGRSQIELAGIKFELALFEFDRSP